jgi:glutathione S-transferase
MDQSRNADGDDYEALRIRPDAIDPRKMGTARVGRRVRSNYHRYVKGEHRSPEFLALNPAGKLPVLVDADLILTESVAIVLYLAEKYPDKHLIPTTLAERAQLNRWLLFTTTELEQPLWRMARHTNIYPKEKRIPQEIAIARDDFFANGLDSRPTYERSSIRCRE